jgi:hypothetical protein
VRKSHWPVGQKRGDTDSPKRFQLSINSNLVIAILGVCSPRIPELENDLVVVPCGDWIRFGKPRFMSELMTWFPWFKNVTVPLEIAFVFRWRHSIRARKRVLELILLLKGGCRGSGRSRDMNKGRISRRVDKISGRFGERGK